MSRIHDMGGRFGTGELQPETGLRPFHADWHKRALAVTLAAGALGKWNIDVSRHARECLAPQDYARFSYYEKWIAALADLLVKRGVIPVEELAGTAAPTRSALAEKCLAADQVGPMLARGGPADRTSPVAPLFQVGDKVRSRRLAENLRVEGGHTRLPRYAAGAEGVVLRLHGSHVLPDSNAHDLGEAPEPLYAVAFPAAALWAHPEHPDDEVVLDLWQSYLAPA